MWIVKEFNVTSAIRVTHLEHQLWLQSSIVHIILENISNKGSNKD